MKIYFITFANTASGFSLDRIRYEAEKMEIFDQVICYNENDFDKSYWKKYHKNFTYERGFGYWSWKPYFIKKTLATLNDRDVVVYADAGCMLLRENRERLKEWINRTSISKSGILSPCHGPYLEHEWTRYDLYDYINTTYNKDNIDIFLNTIQCGAGILVISKRKSSVDFIDKWNDVMSNHFHLCTDEKSSLPNHPNFHENRHDQSVFSMLSKIYGIERIETKKGILDKQSSPIICTRCKNDELTWQKPINVLYDHQTYDNQRFGGISRMFVELHRNHDRNEIVENFTGSGIARGKYADVESEFSVLNTENEYLKTIKPYNTQKKGNNREYSIELLKKGKFDIFYPTFFDTYFLEYLNGKPFVMSVHDMIPELYPQFFSRTDPQIVGKIRMVKQAAAIEVPTNTTKNDLMRILGVPEEKIHVIGRGLKSDFGENCNLSDFVGFKYILYVGQRNGYKRFNWFVKHIKPYLERHTDVNVLCTGARFNKFEIDYVKSVGIGDRFFNTFVDDNQLAALYKNAQCFVFPSEYEGFGIPILEAYKMECPILLNNNACFREVTFNEGEFFEMSEDESNLSERLEELMSTPKEQLMRIRKDLLNTYTWKNCADKLKEIFKKTYQHNG